MSSNEPGASFAVREDVNWRKDVISQLRERNSKQTNCFADLIGLRKYACSLFVSPVSRIDLLLLLSLCLHMLCIVIVATLFHLLCTTDMPCWNRSHVRITSVHYVILESCFV